MRWNQRAGVRLILKECAGIGGWVSARSGGNALGLVGVSILVCNCTLGCIWVRMNIICSV